MRTKLTYNQLKQIIKEELEWHLSNENPLKELLLTIRYKKTTNRMFIIKNLLQRKDVDVNAVSEQFHSNALMLACNIEYRDYMVASLLLKHPRIDVNIQNEYGWTALMYACYSSYTFINNNILKYINKSVKIIKLLLQHPSIDVNIQDNKGRTALMIATNTYESHVYTEFCNLLLQHPSIDVNIQDNNGNTILHYAAEKDNDGLRFLELLLLRSDLNLNIKNNSGETALDVAEKYYNLKLKDNKLLINLLKQHGAR